MIPEINTSNFLYLIIKIKKKKIERGQKKKAYIGEANISIEIAFPASMSK